MRAAVFAIALAACSPVQRYAFRRCPLAVVLFADFAASAALLGLGVLTHSTGHYGRAGGYTAAGMGLVVAAGYSECRR